MKMRECVMVGFNCQLATAQSHLEGILRVGLPRLGKSMHPWVVVLITRKTPAHCGWHWSLSRESWIV